MVVIVIIAAICALAVDVFVVYNVEKHSPLGDSIASKDAWKPESNDSNTAADKEDNTTASQQNLRSDDEFDTSRVIIEYPSNWSMTVNDYIYLDKTDLSSDGGDFRIQIAKYYYKDDENFTSFYGPSKDVVLGPNTAKLAYKPASYGVAASANYLISVGEEKYLCNVEYSGSRDFVGDQILSTFQIK